jgi:hypothetical protein
MCFLLETVSYCVFFYKLNTDYIFYPTVTGEMMSPCASVPGATVAMDRRRSSLLSYHYSDTLVAMGRLSVVDAESFTAVTRTRPLVPEIGPRASVPGAGDRTGQTGGLTISGQGLAAKLWWVAV